MNITLTLTLEDVNFILKSLMRQPWEKANTLIIKVQSQAQTQVNEQEAQLPENKPPSI